MVLKKVGFLDGSVGKESACNAEDPGDSGLTLGREDLLEEGTATHSQYSCLENPIDRGPWRATIHEVTENWT